MKRGRPRKYCKECGKKADKFYTGDANSNDECLCSVCVVKSIPNDSLNKVWEPMPYPKWSKKKLNSYRKWCGTTRDKPNDLEVIKTQQLNVYERLDRIETLLINLTTMKKDISKLKKQIFGGK